MDYLLTDEQKMIKDLAHKIAAVLVAMSALMSISIPKRVARSASCKVVAILILPFHPGPFPCRAVVARYGHTIHINMRIPASRYVHTCPFRAMIQWRHGEQVRIVYPVQALVAERPHGPFEGAGKGAGHDHGACRGGGSSRGMESPRRPS